MGCFTFVIMFSTHFSNGIQRPSVSTDPLQNVLLAWPITRGTERLIGAALMFVGIASLLYLFFTGKTGTISHTSSIGPRLSTGVFIHLALSITIMLWGFISFRHPYYQVGKLRVTDPLQQISVLPTGLFMFSVPLMASVSPFLDSERRSTLFDQLHDTLTQPWWVIGLGLLVAGVILCILYRTAVYWLRFAAGIVKVVRYDSRLRSRIMLGKNRYRRGEVVDLRLEYGKLKTDKSYRVFLLGVGTNTKHRVLSRKRRTIYDYHHVDFKDIDAVELESGVSFSLPDQILDGPESVYQQWELLIEENGSDFWLRYQLPV